MTGPCGPERRVSGVNKKGPLTHLGKAWVRRSWKRMGAAYRGSED
ncbi:hypothetical protein AK973_5194 [Pseudomonas brassicacearum]|nr:hypothetical protein AK973_5194 [Pseudomonas brassicacearum]